MAAGVLVIIFRLIDKKDPGPEVGTLFKGFDYFIESLVVTLIIVLANVVIMVPVVIGFIVVMAVTAGLAEGTNSGEVVALSMFPLFLLLFLIIAAVSVLVYGLMFFAYPLLVERNMQAMPALKLSARAVWANIWGVVGLMLLNWLIAMIASLFCYIPALLYMPIMFGSFAVAYRKMFPELAPPPPPAM